MNNYFEFIMYLAFQIVLNYENKRQLTIEELHNYRVTLCKKTHDCNSISPDDDKLKQKLEEFLRLNLNMTEEEERDMFAIFIKNNGDIFTFSSGIISLKPEITLEKIRDLKFELDSYATKDDIKICSELISIYDCLECLKVLNVSKIPNEVQKIVGIEKAIENAYQNYQDMNAQNQIRVGNYLIAAQISRISKMSSDKIGCYTKVIKHMQSMPDAKGDAFWLLSDYIQENDVFYRGNDYIDYELRNKYQRAIFDTNVLAYTQLSEYMDLLWMYQNPLEPIEVNHVHQEQEEVDEEELAEEDYVVDDYEDEFDDEDYTPEDFTEDSDEDELDEIKEYLHSEKVYQAFYLNHIKTLNEYQSKYGINEILETSKRRLLYTLNSSRFNLFEEENFQEKLSEISIGDFNYKEDFFDFYVMSRLFLIDILEKWIDDEYTLRKLLFVQTYYDLTHDIRIKRIINKYQKTELGTKVKAIVLEHKSFEDTPSSNLTKKLTNQK